MSGRVSVELRGFEEFAGRIRKGAAAIKAGEARGVERGAQIGAARLRERTNRAGAPPSRRASAKRRASYAARLAAGGGSSDFLFVRSGNLRRSVGASRAALVGSSYEARFGFRTGAVPYGPVHEYGSPRKNIRARAPVRRSLEDRRTQITAAIRAEIAASTAQAFG